jgi:serine/threonine protein kinase
MSVAAFGPLGILLGIVAVIVAVIAGTYLLVLALKLVFFLLARAGTYIAATVTDTLRLIGAVPTTIVLILLVVFSIVLGRWSACAHYFRGIKREIALGARCIYGILIAHPLRLFGMTALIEGMEQRVVEDVRRAPGPDKPGRRTGQFPGYTIVGSLPGGGSGGKLYIAEPNDEKRDALNRQDIIRATGGCPDRVVIKSFSIADGSTLPNMVRESRALEAAKKLGLILEHDLSDTRFYYIMPYVPGDDLGEVTRQRHAAVRGNQLPVETIRELVGYAINLVETLDHYHHNGLWHKDVKPENIIVHDGKAHLVDFGLVTPLQSAMTLTTHGTEYFRDPELVRMALRGVKVHEVDGAKFDVYAAGAVLYYMLENTFPAHGGLSRLSMRHPDAVAWVIRRAMTEYSQRYPTAEALLKDLRTIVAAEDPFALKPVHLPSMGGADAEAARAAVDDAMGEAETVAQAATPGPAAGQEKARSEFRATYTVASPSGDGSGQRPRPRITVTDWWTGRYKADPIESRGDAAREAASGLREVREEVRSAVRDARRQVKQSINDFRDKHGGVGGFAPGRPVSPAGRTRDQIRRAAREQVHAARERANRRRDRAYRRMNRRHEGPGAAGIAGRVVGAVVLFAAALAALGFVINEMEGKPTLRVDKGQLMGPQPQVIIGDSISNDGVAVHAAASVETGVGDETPFTVPPAPPATEPLGDMLLINDHPAALEPHVRRIVQRELARMHDQGIGIVADEEVEAEIRARGSIGDFGDAATAMDVAARLRAAEDLGALGVVWIAGDPDNPNHIRVWVIPGIEDTDADDDPADQLADRLETLERDSKGDATWLLSL